MKAKRGSASAASDTKASAVGADPVIEDAAPADRELRPASSEYRISLPTFEGPLDLLLHLIQKHELEILDIPVSFVTEKYLEYLKLMRDLSIDLASEYLVMAATLVHIKSRTLLPLAPADDEEEGVEEEVDPRAELIRRLLEYQKYKQAAADLGERGTLGQDVFLRGSPAPKAQGPAPLAPVGLFGLLEAFSKLIARAKVDVSHEVSFDKMTITERIQQLCDKLAGRASCRFDDLFDDVKTRGDVVITFLAMLEMARLKMMRIYQAEPLADIYLELSVGDKEAVGAPSAELSPLGDEVPAPGSLLASAPPAASVFVGNDSRQTDERPVAD